MSDPRKGQGPEPVSFLLSPPVQFFVAINLLCGWLGILLWSGWGLRRDRQIDFDTVVPKAQAFQVELNTASWVELAQLPGIGKTLGNRIVARRTARGAYHTIDELIEIKGIGPRVLDGIRPFLIIDRLSSDHASGGTEGRETP